MKCIFAIDIMKNLTNTAFTWYDDCFFIILVIVFSFDGLRPYKEWIHTFILCLITITTTCSNLGDLPNFHILNSIRAILLNELFDFRRSSSLLGNCGNIFLHCTRFVRRF